MGTERDDGTERRERLSRAAIVAAAIALADERGVGALTMRDLAEALDYKVMALYNHVANKDDLLSLMVDAVAAEIDEPSSTEEPHPAQTPEGPLTQTPEGPLTQTPEGPLTQTPEGPLTQTPEGPLTQTPEGPLTQTPEGPLSQVRALAIATRAALVRHSWATELWLRYLPGPARNSRMETLLRLLAESPLSPKLAHDGFHAINNHVLGYTLQEFDLTQMQGDDPQATIDAFLSSISVDTHPHTVAHVQQHLDGDTDSSFELVLDLILDGLLALSSCADDNS